MKIKVWLRTNVEDKTAFREDLKNWFGYLELYEINYKVRGNGTARRMICKLDKVDIKYLTGLENLIWETD